VREDTYVTTRRQLRGIAESFIAGPQYRSAGTIRLAVRPDGFTGVSIAVAVHGTELVWGGDGAPLTGTVGALAAATDLDVGPPQGAYEIVDPLPAVCGRDQRVAGHALTKIADLRALVFFASCLDGAVQLTQRDDGDLQLFREGLQTAGDLADLLLARVDAVSPLHELQVVDDHEADLPRLPSGVVGAIELGLEAPRLRPQLEDREAR